MTKMFLSIKKKKSTIETSDQKFGDIKCLNNNINNTNNINNIVDNSQSTQLQLHNSTITSENINSIVDNSHQTIVLQNNKNFNSKSQFAGASEIYGNNNMEKQSDSPISIVNGSTSSKPYIVESKSHTLKRMFKRVLDFNKKKDVDPKLNEFLKLVDYHREFFKRSPEIDRYVMTLAFIYLRKAFPNDSSISNELFFYSLYLAWETEEDSTLGLESIIHYIIGSYPSSKNKDKNQRKQEIIEWRMRLRQFHTGKDILWRALDYKTVVDYPQLQKTIKTFPNHDILKRERTSTTSIKFF